MNFLCRLGRHKWAYDDFGRAHLNVCARCEAVRPAKNPHVCVVAGPRQRAARAASRLYPLMSGCTFPNHPRFVALSAAPAIAVWTPVKGGEVLARLDDFVGRCAYFVGDLDRKVSAVFDRVMRPGDVAIDVGANIGITALRLAALAGHEGRVHAIEPNPALAAQIRQTAARSGVSTLSVHTFALGAEDGAATLSIPSGNMGAASIVAGHSAASAGSISVSVRRLDDLFGDLKTLRLIKIDAEGAEPQILAGAAETIARLRPVVLFEWNSPGAPPAFDKSHYRLFGLRKTLFGLTLDRVEAPSRAFHDYVAIPYGPEFQGLCKRLNARQVAAAKRSG